MQESPPHGASTEFAVSIRDAAVTYDGAPLFRDISLSLPRGGLSCLLGPSGVGKSTLLRAVAGLVPLTEGRITCDDGAATAGRVAWMGQDPLLLPWADALSNVTLGARLRGEPSDDDRARALLNKLGLGEAADRMPAKLSGGMRQRVALARTLYEKRPIVLMDEPFAALDALTRRRLQAEAVEALAGRTVLLVTHDPWEALRMGSRIVVMAGSPPRIIEAPVPSGSAPRDADQPGMAEAYRALLSLLEPEIPA